MIEPHYRPFVMGWFEQYIFCIKLWYIVFVYFSTRKGHDLSMLKCWAIWFWKIKRLEFSGKRNDEPDGDSEESESEEKVIREGWQARQGETYWGMLSNAGQTIGYDEEWWGMMRMIGKSLRKLPTMVLIVISTSQKMEILSKFLNFRIRVSKISWSPSIISWAIYEK